MRLRKYHGSFLSRILFPRRTYNEVFDMLTRHEDVFGSIRTSVTKADARSMLNVVSLTH